MFSSTHLVGALVLSFLGVTNAALGPIGDLRIENRVINPDGFNRSAVLAGGTFPGPLITGNKGARFKLNVTDALTDKSMLLSTTIHWHGIHQKGTNLADGVAFVTQCPIAANDSFLYDFSVPNRAGTFWYHSHLSTQYCDGLRGAMVVYDPKDPHQSLYDIDDDSTIITLADWYHETAHAIISSLTPPHAASTLINGIGRYTGGPMVPLAIINVRQGQRYRFRIIAMACEPYFKFSIDSHLMTVIEADGENTDPLPVDYIELHAGQRYSVVVNAQQPVGNYWIRSDPGGPLGNPGFDGGRNSAILRYAGAPDVDPVTVQTPSRRPLKEVNLHALASETPAAPGLPKVGGADVVLNIAHDFDDATRKYRMNGHPYIPPTVPAFLQIMSGAKTAQALMPTDSYYELPRNKVIELSLPGTTRGGPHPFHLHGHSFSVIRSAYSTDYNFANPVRRDTLDTGLLGSNATIRFVTDNAGPWFLHCHIDFHLELGLAVVFAEDIPNTVAENPASDAWKNLCPRYDSLTPDQLGTG